MGESFARSEIRAASYAEFLIFISIFAIFIVALVIIQPALENNSLVEHTCRLEHMEFSANDCPCTGSMGQCIDGQNKFACTKTIVSYQNINGNRSYAYLLDSYIQYLAHDWCAFNSGKVQICQQNNIQIDISNYNSYMTYLNLSEHNQLMDMTCWLHPNALDGLLSDPSWAIRIKSEDGHFTIVDDTDAQRHTLHEENRFMNDRNKLLDLGKMAKNGVLFPCIAILVFSFSFD